MGLFDPIYKAIASNIADLLSDNPEAQKRRKYYIGDQKHQLRVKDGKADDNVIVNLVGLAVDRSVTHVLAGGVEFDLPGDTETENPQQEYIDNLWEVNKKSLLLLNSVINGGVYGTGYIKIKPDGLIDPYSDIPYPRLIALNPEFLTIKTDPQDQERIIAYVVEYTIGDTTYRETTRLAQADDYEIPPAELVTWVIVNEKQDGKTGRWELIDKTEWPYTFPNIVHWKNLPSLNSVYGSSDIDDILGMQDKQNFTVSNIQKQVRLQSHKQPWGRGVNNEKLDVGADSFIALKGENAELGIMDFQTDITGSLAFSKDLRQSLFDVAREVDITSITDKLGALTNFGLRVLYSDALGKTDTKRLLFGEALLELNRRLLVLNGWEGEDSRPGEVKWQDPLPVNIIEKYQAQAEELAMGTVDKQTIAEENGRDWETIQTRLQEEKAANNNALGVALLNFNQGKGNNAL